MASSRTFSTRHRTISKGHLDRAGEVAEWKAASAAQLSHASWRRQCWWLALVLALRLESEGTKTRRMTFLFCSSAIALELSVTASGLPCAA
jgi:ABC-type enterobactin transport system permease subunit